MRMNMGKLGGVGGSSLSSSGGTMAGSLILANGPSQPLEAATKYYVDTTFANLSANNVLEGMFPLANLPNFTGDVNNTQGSGVISLTNIGVTPGTYAKVIVDGKGRVTGNDVLSSGDLPEFDFSKITVNKPTTLAGYGITDALSSTGGIMTGLLSVANPTSDLSAVNKTYVDGALSNSGVSVGDVIRKPLSTTPTGFLRCNGANLDKTTYAGLYAVIGDTFNNFSTSVPGNGQPWRQQYQINTEQTTDITGWTTGTSLPGILGNSSVIVTNNRVYLLGGETNAGHVSTVYTAPINANGTIGTWTTGTSLPGILSRSQAIVTKNRVYLMGGNNGSYVSIVYTAPINSDGTLGAWTTDTNLPSALAYSQAILTKNRVYLLGGYNGSSTLSTVYTASINTDGTLGTWTTGTSLPIAIGYSQAIVTKNRVYLLGGQNSSVLSTVYTAPINSDGTLGAWTTGISLPNTLYSSQAIVTKNRVYLLGGYNGSSAVSTVYTAPINSDGSLGTWTISTSIPGNLFSSSIITIKNNVYLLGGIIIGNVVSTVYTAPIAGGLNDYSPYYAEDTTNYMTVGSGKPWQQQYQMNETQVNDITGWTTGTSLPSVLSWSTAVVTKNRVYIMSGWNGSSSQSVVYTATIAGDGTLGVWTTATSLPGAIDSSQAIVTKNRVYILGGANGGPQSTVYTAPINSDGTLGTWATGTSLPGVLYNSQTVITKNRVYMLGGYNGSAISTVYTAVINTDGTLGTWTTATSLPITVYGHTVFITKNKIHLCGGYNGSALSSVYTATINSDGGIGIWSTSVSLPASIYSAQSVVTKNRVYIIGRDGSSAIYNAPINADGTIGAWVTGTSLPAQLNRTQAILTNSRVYLIGGQDGASNVSTVYTASINGGLNDYEPYYDGTIAPIIPAPAVDTTTNFMEPGSGQPWRQQYQINETQVNDITGWTTGTSLPITLANSQAIVTKNRVYTLGGHNGSAYISTVYTAPINTDGTLGTWTTGTSLPGTIANSSAIVTKNRVYLLGGYSNVGGYLSTVYTAPINSDGTLGTWATGASLPGALGDSQAIVTKNRVYLLGGNNSGTFSTVYTATINTDGTLGGWTTGTSLPAALAYSQAIVTKNRVYLCGGYNGSINVSTVYTASINSDGTLGTWTTGTSLPGTLSTSQAIVTKNRVYLFGGNNGTTVYTAPINIDGTLGIWATGASLPGIIDTGPAIVTKNRVYLLGGYIGFNVYSSAVYTAPLLEGLNDYSSYYDSTIAPTLNATYTNDMTPGSGKPWQQQYQINTTQTADITGWTTGTALPGNLGGSQAIVTKNRVYLMGGYNGSAYVSTVYTAPLNLDGTIGTWTTSTSLPGILGGSQVIVTKNRVYLLGGNNGSRVSTIYTAVINSDGTLGTWSLSGNLPAVLGDSTSILTKGRIYLFGGHNGSAYVSTVYSAAINVDGTLGNWITETALPAALGSTSAVITKNRVYLLGTRNTSTVYTATINSDGVIGTWTTGTSLPGNMAHSSVISTKNKVYLLGGYNDGSGVISTVYTASINDDGTLGTWTTGTSLPGIFRESSVVLTNSRVYLLGGYSSNYTSTVYTASILEGLNDYSPYYDGTLGPYIAPEPTNYMMPGSGRPWNQQYQINTTQSTDITGWTTSTSLPGSIKTSYPIVTKNRVYLLGGYDGSANVSTVYTAPLNTDGTIGTWTLDSPMPGITGGGQAIFTKNRVYMLGGNASGAISTVYTAAINSDGTLGTWTTSSSLPVPLQSSQAIVTKNRVYLLGGSQTGSGYSTSYTAPINSDGSLGTWSVTGNSLPSILYTSQAVVTNNYVYLLGGNNATNATSTVYVAPIYNDGGIGTWSTSTSLPSAINESSVIVTKNRVYLLGGNTGGSSYTATVYTALINSDGTLGAWTTGTSLPGGIGASKAIMTKNRVYIMGGYTGSVWVNTVYTAPILEGLNDLSPYYDGTIVPVATPLIPIDISFANLFSLPDIVAKEKSNLNYFIKY